MITIEKKVHFNRGRRSRKEMRVGKKPAPVVRAPRIPRIARLMALAIRFDQLIRDGVVTDQAELARLGHVSRARLTQIMNLLNLAPDIQESLLFMEPAARRREMVTERQLREITAYENWKRQRGRWQSLRLTLRDRN